MFVAARSMHIHTSTYMYMLRVLLEGGMALVKHFNERVWLERAWWVGIGGATCMKQRAPACQHLDCSCESV